MPQPIQPSISSVSSNKGDFRQIDKPYDSKTSPPTQKKPGPSPKEQRRSVLKKQRFQSPSPERSSTLLEKSNNSSRITKW